MRYTLMTYIPVRCTLMRYTLMRCTPMRCTPHEVHAREVHADEIYPREIHAYEMHACEVHTREMHILKMHAQQVHAHKIPAYEMHILEMRAREMYAYEMQNIPPYGHVSTCEHGHCGESSWAPLIQASVSDTMSWSNIEDAEVVKSLNRPLYLAETSILSPAAIDGPHHGSSFASDLPATPSSHRNATGNGYG
jgi:hypothetical protein